MTWASVHAASRQQMQSAYSSFVVPLAVRSPSHDFEADLERWDMGDRVDIVHMRARPAMLRRTQQHVSASNDGYLVLGMNLSGTTHVGTETSSCTLAGPSAALVTTDSPSILGLETPVEHITIRMPRKALPVAESIVARSTWRALSADNASFRILTSFLRSVEAEAAMLDRSAGETLASVTTDLIATALTSAIGERSSAQSPAMQLRAMLQLIREDYADPELSVGAIASHFRVSERYVHRVFGDAQETPGGAIQAERICRARELLQRTDMTVGAVAGAVGFQETSTFHRAFRRAEGTTPGAWRADNKH